MSASGGAPDGSAPPAYTTNDNSEAQTNAPSNIELTPEALAELSSAFSSLNLPNTAADVSPDSCLAHLKLLYAFQNLKEDVGYCDGLWQIFDSRAELDTYHYGDETGADKLGPEDRVARNLARLREKRWAVYVARAVDRYEAWWDTFTKNPLTETDMEGPDQSKYSRFIIEVPRFGSTMLPPLDVLLVWHAHMLNPRAYLEDCLRHGLKGLWHRGMPWRLVNTAIDTKFDYEVSDVCKKAWQTKTGREWDNIDDPVNKTLKCPKCIAKLEIPWTTCGVPEDYKYSPPKLDGNGFGDGNLVDSCPSCGTIVNRQLLEVTRFVKDVQNLIVHGVPMPGTVLGMQRGLPVKIPESGAKSFPRTFPNRLLGKYFGSGIIELLNQGSYKQSSMEDVRKSIEDTVKRSNYRILQMIDGYDALKRGYKLSPLARSHIRKMMSRYWNNIYPFALDLAGAVHRQGIFMEKMYKIDWIHSPAARETTNRLILKYQRFTKIMATHPNHVAVPTLDVDLAWHTQQLSPTIYLHSMVQQTGRFIDHDDKIDEVKLADAFEWTSKVYQETYDEVYSECTCWYCESIRASHVSSVGKLLGVSKNEKVAQSFHESGRADLCPPDASAHISAHNSVRLEDVDSSQARLRRRRLWRAQQRIDDQYEKARRRAQKKGRDIPPKDEYYHNYWGYPYLMYGPWAYPIYMTPGVYPCDPGHAVAGTGAEGACAAGTCGGGAAAGACAGAGAGACGGTGSCGGTAGGCGGGGASCGGGGGGCGGGGGGGGGGCGGGGGGGGC